VDAVSDTTDAHCFGLSNGHALEATGKSVRSSRRLTAGVNPVTEFSLNKIRLANIQRQTGSLIRIVLSPYTPESPVGNLCASVSSQPVEREVSRKAVKRIFAHRLDEQIAFNLLSC
jgi:hypothetical protein